MASVISQELLDKIVSYDYSHDSFEAIKEGLLSEIGDGWHSASSEIIESMSIDNKEKILENVTQIVNYDGALSAWEEGHELLEHKDDVTIEYLSDRLPAIEYWLGFFDGGGDELLQKLKNIIEDKKNASISANEVPVEDAVSPVAEEVGFDATPDTVADVEVPVEEVVSPVAEEVGFEATPDTVADVEVPVEEVVSPVAEEVGFEATPDAVAGVEAPVEEVVSPVAEEVAFEATPDTVAGVEAPVEEVVNPVVASDEAAMNDVSMDENQTNAQIQAQNNIESFFETTSNLEQAQSPENVEDNLAHSEGVEPAEVLVEERAGIADAHAVTEDANMNVVEVSDGGADFVVPHGTSSDPSFAAIKKSGTGLEAIPLEEPLASSNPTHWEWYVNRFLRLNDYYDQTISRTSARCVSLGGISLADYPYFEYVLDVLAELIDMGKQILGKPAVHNLIKERIPKGIKGLEEIIKAYETEFNNNAPPEMFDKASDMAMVKARLGQLVENSIDEDIGPAPDGFVVEDEPSISFS